MTVDDAIARTLEIWRAEPFDWLTGNCAVRLADYQMLLDPKHDSAARWRGRCRTEEEALGLVREAGGMLAMFAKGLGPVAREVQHPERGDIVVCDNGRIGAPIAGLHLGSLIAFSTVEGLAMTRRPVLGAWRCA